MLMFRCAQERRAAGCDRRPKLRALGRGIAIGAMLVAFAAFGQETRTEIAPQHGVQPPASPVPPTPPTVPTTAVAQPAVAQPPAAQPPAAELPGANHKPGFIDVFGRFIGDSTTKLNSQLKSTNETLGHLGGQTSDAAKDAVKDAAMGAVGTAKDAAGTLMGLPSARIVTGRERCVIAQNGVPDCRAAADAACRGKGFGSGRSLDTQSAQKCPARVWLSGRFPAEGDCQLETFVTRAVCQ
jgi:hypothetical protein